MLSSLATWHPPVGVFIALLALIGVLVPWFRGEANRREKALWTLLMFVFVGLEIRSIYMDQAEHDKQQADARTQQINSFSQIGQGINATIETGQQQFKETMRGFEANLNATNKAINNTRPRAILQIKHVAFQRPAYIPPTKRVGFNILLENAGNDTAKQFAYVVHTYVGKLDDAEFQKGIYADFIGRWQTEHTKALHGSLSTGGNPYISIESDVLTNEEIQALTTSAQTLYMILRFSWIDQTGLWATDYCGGYQEKLFTSEVVHPCIDPKTNEVRHRL